MRLRLANTVVAVVVCSLALASNATAESLTAWGNNDFGQCNVPAGNDFVAISAGTHHSLALKSDGSLAAWGNNVWGQCNVPAGNDFVAISAGGDHSLAIKTDGSLAAWGSNQSGECNVPAGNDFVAVSAGGFHNLAIKTDGSLAAWGHNAFEQCNVPAGNDFVAISAGNLHSLAIKTDGSLAAWGSNQSGECNVPAGNDFVAVSAGFWHSLALRADGSLAAWERNDYEQCNHPTGNDFVAVSSGGYFSLAPNADGSLTAWGGNYHGECNVPVGNEFVAISAGYRQSLAMILPANKDPLADAGPDQEVQCAGALTVVTLDATGSSDPDGDELGFEWSLPEGSDATLDDPFSPTPIGLFPLGPTLVTLTVTDGNGGVACADVLVTIVDTIPPVLVATTNKIALWPPNHEIHVVLVSVEITDCAWDISATVAAFVASSEPDDGTGDGSYVNDVNGEDGFAAPVLMDLIYAGEPEPGVYSYQGLAYLRAERDGSERSRAYSVVCDIEDLAGNTSTASCVVIVPHDRRRN